MDTPLGFTENVPKFALSSILRDYLREPEAELTNCIIAPVSHSGMSGDSSLYRADIEWITSNSSIPASSTSWLIKCWKPGGLSLSELGWTRPVEALAWQHGILRPESLPHGVRTPIVGAVTDPGGAAAWVAMTDVSKELREYDRAAPLPPERLVSHAKTILAGLARFHAFWEQPDRQELLEGKDWLLPFENYLWRNAATCAAILKKDVVGEFSQVNPAIVEDELSLQAFLEWLEPSARPIWEELLVDRSRLVDRFTGLPFTLLHGDLDDRNIGLSWSASGESELVLIDWEWMGKGPAAIDVAKVFIYLPLICEPTSPCPEACWSGELLDDYYENYRAAGGKQFDYDSWRRSYDLGLVAQALWPFPWAVGIVLRALDGKAPLPEFPGLPEEAARMMLASAMERIKRLMDSIRQAMNRCFF
jgi:Phosphotransferase enzyme family